MQSSNKTGLVLKISIVLLVLLALVVYKLNDYFKNEKQFIVETQLRNKVIQIKTTVSSQLSQLKNILSSYETEMSEANINWVQLDPFFAIAKLEDTGRSLRVDQLLVRSNTPAEHWNSRFLEKALLLNKSSGLNPINGQLFQDRAGAKFLILRFKISKSRELAVVGSADYFQKFFDNERGEQSTSLLATTENLLAAHSEGDYIATPTEETRLTKKKYLLEKEDIVGTNLIAMTYVLKKKIAGGFVIPWSIVGVIAGFGCILVAIIFYNLDPIERKVERLKKQERAQIYKDTLGGMVQKAEQANAAQSAFKPAPRVEPVLPSVPDVKAEPDENEVTVKTALIKAEDQPTQTVEVENIIDAENTNTAVNAPQDQFVALEESQFDLSDIEKALALDDFDNDDVSGRASTDILKENLTSQKISISTAGARIDKPQFALNRKDFKVNEFKVNVRRPENS